MMRHFCAALRESIRMSVTNTIPATFFAKLVPQRHDIGKCQTGQCLILGRRVGQSRIFAAENE
jgi:hypothetical protein